MRQGQQCHDEPEQGPPGEPGSVGPRGEPGKDGESIVGPQGSPGKDGSIITPVIPCPTLGGSHPEVLLCIDQKLYAVYDGYQAQDTRYVQLEVGTTYQTTDGRACIFRVLTGCNLQ